jgi:DNA-binding SARP family transcriptional activator
MKSLAARLLGEFSVDGIESTALGSRKARLALHLLALAEGLPVPGDVLTDALWGDSPPARPDDQLAVLMSRLRSVLGRDRIEHQPGGYVLHADWQDTIELRHLTDEIDRRASAGNLIGAAAAARVALGLLRERGQAQLTGEWAQLRTARVDRLCARSRLACAEALLAAGDWMAAVDAAAAAIENDPYEEAALRILMRAYVLGGQSSAAVAAYARARERLAEDLGTDPSPATAELYTAILRGELRPAAPPAAGDGLMRIRDNTAKPGTGLRLAGRRDELAFLDARAGAPDGGAQVILIDGEAGIGKTSLLRAWARQRAAAGETILIASCGKLDRSMPLDAVLTALAGLIRGKGAAGTDLLGPDAALLGPLLGASPGPRPLPVLADSMLGPAVLYRALTSVLSRLAAEAPLILLIDDAHLAGPALRDWIEFLQRDDLPLLVVAAARAGAAVPLPATATIHLGALDRAEAAEIVGAGRVDVLFEKSGGNPLFLTELAQQPADAELPASLVESVSARCDELGRSAALLRTAAVMGPDLDLDLIAAVLGRPLLELMDDCEVAVRQQFLAEENGQLQFRHELVRDALAASASAGRAALLHRQAGRVLARRPAADPVLVAEHARLGGDVALAASALRDAARRATERFDHAAAEALLDDAISLHEETESWLDRARVRIRRSRYSEALADVERSGRAADADALEVSAWASYFDRRFAPAAQFAEEGAIAAADAATRARCLAVAGRIWHAAGDLARAQTQLVAAMKLAEGADRVTAAAWLGVLRAHQSRPADALPLLRPAARGQTGAEHTSATMHALLFTGHAHASAGQPEQALAAFARHTAEVDRRQVPRFAGRGVNFAGWVLRNLGASDAALDCHTEALEAASRMATPEVAIAVLEDLAELRLDAGDAEGAATLLAAAQEKLTGDLVFGWRLELKHDLVAARMALLRGDAELVLATAATLAETAGKLGIPRYASAAGLLRHRAAAAIGLPPDLPSAERDLDLMERSVAIESWWWTGETAAALRVPAWLDRAAEQASRLAAAAGGHGDTLRRHADARIRQWQDALR